MRMSMQQPSPPETGPHTLPLYLTPFVGREAERADIARRLSDPACRLLTLVGPGGIGKTRLAVEVARDALARCSDGVWLVDLAGLTNPELVPQAVASALGLRETPERPPLETLVAYFQTGRRLLVLDNCEHLLQACTRLAQVLLAACPDLCILATSREPLHIAGEVVRPVPPLSLPDPERLPSPENLLQYEAAKLFVDRAQSVYPAFTLTPDNAPTVAQVCHRLDGLPLALELAAARVKVLSVAQILQRLDDSFRLLVGAPTAPARQQTLAATLDWSHDLLSGAETVLFRRLAVFAGGFSLTAAEGMCAGDGLDPAELLNLLSGLVDKSLVTVERGEGPERRYRLLETVRQYARQKLQAAGEDANLADRHLRWYLEWAEQAEPYLWGSAEPALLEQMQAHQDDLRAALQWALETGHGEEALRLASALNWFWYVRAQLHEGRHWLERALAQGESTSTLSRARALQAAGSLAVLQCDYNQSTALLEEAVGLHSELGNDAQAAWSLSQLGLANLCLGRYDQAEQRLEQSMSAFQAVDDDVGAAIVLLYHGLTACHQGDYERATALLQAGLPALREMDDAMSVARALIGLGTAARHQGDPDRARNLFGEALHTAHDTGARLEVAQSLEGLAGVARTQGHLHRAARLFGAADAQRQTIGADPPPGTRADYDRDLAAIHTQLGEESFTAAWTEGRALSLEEAIAFATTPAPAREPTPKAQPLTPLQAAKERYGGLTRRQRQVAALVAQGKRNQTIADELVVTVRTVEAHITHILRTLGFSSRTQIATWAVDQGLAEPPTTLDDELRAG
jgi:predicted ATPase/DNA-binding CsgD family transcriptional regulator